MDPLFIEKTSGQVTKNGKGVIFRNCRFPFGNQASSPAKKMTQETKLACIALCLLITFILSSFLHPCYSAEPTMADFSAAPPFISTRVDPNVLLILDNSGSMNYLAYQEVSGNICSGTQVWTGFNESQEYYGYFDPNKTYKYDNANHYFYSVGVTYDDPNTAIYERSAGDATAPVLCFSGNWLNWWTMRRLDVAKKVLTGGRLAADPGADVLLGAATDARDLRRTYNDYTATTDPDGRATKNVYYTPFRQYIYSYWDNEQRNGEMTTTFNIVQIVFTTCEDNGAYLELANNPVYDNVGETLSYQCYYVAVKADEVPDGIVQKMGSKVRFGYMQFNYGYTGGAAGAGYDFDGDGNRDVFWEYDDGGRVRNYVGDDTQNIIDNINNQTIQMMTPLEEVLNEAVRYFKQEVPCYSGGAANYHTTDEWDPYFFNDFPNPAPEPPGKMVPCAKSFIILLTDGEPNNNDRVTSCGGWNVTFDGDGSFDSNNTLLDDIAYTVHTQDIRSEDGVQNLTLYTVFTFNDPNSTVQLSNYLKQAARAGGFNDLDESGDEGYQQPYCEENCGGWGSNFYPGTCGTRDATGECIQDPRCREWDEDCDGVPDNYFEAQDGAKIEEDLLTALTDILRRNASGTAVSILSTSAHGDGALFQAFFKPKETSNFGALSAEADWLGYLHGLWVDSRGNLREDTNNDLKLSYETDNIIEFYFDETEGSRVRRDYVSAAAPFGDKDWDEINLPMNAIQSLWEGGQKLALRDPDDRNIFTNYKDTQTDFNVALVNSDPDFKYHLRATTDSEAEDIVRYIRGEEVANKRPRTVYFDTDGDTVTDAGGTWKLGDIIYSTPAVVGRPMENYDALYGDKSYKDFEQTYIYGRSFTGRESTKKPRPTTIYVGGNDGMLHAFNAGCYVVGDDTNSEETENGRYTDDYPSYFSGSPYGCGSQIGDELWAFIPKNVLPHLQWLTDINYTHIYYVDLKPKIVDARLWGETGDSIHINGWGTVLIGGLRYGGGSYTVDDYNLDGTVDAGSTTLSSASYFAIDITNPGDPQVLWEYSNDSYLGQSSNVPVVARVGDPDTAGDWYVIFGSGPTNIQDGTSTQKASVFVLNLKTGAVEKIFGAGGTAIAGNPANGIMAGAAALDMNLDYQTNGIYIGQSYQSGSTWYGRMYRIFIDKPETELYAGPAFWKASSLASMKTNQPISGSPGLSSDHNNTPWVYWGTGRYLSSMDKVTTSTQAFYGVKDMMLSDGADALDITYSDLSDVTGVTVSEDLKVKGSNDVSDGKTFDEMLTAMRGSATTPTNGWYLETIDIGGSNSGERVIGKPVVFSKLVMFSSFKPDNDICGFGGNGRIYMVNYESGAGVIRSFDGGKGTPSDPRIHINASDSLGEDGGGEGQETKDSVDILIQTSNNTIFEQTVEINIPKSRTLMWSDNSLSQEESEGLID